MPGLVGLITKLPRYEAELRLKKMIGAMVKESFYKQGSWSDPDLGVYVGWVTQENSFSDGMPLANESGDVVLVFSGEEFPDRSRRSELRERGHSFATEGPSYLVHSCEDDASFPKALNGWFHGLVADRRRSQVTLFNDRYGMHRVYFHEAKEAFYFAGEAKAILAVNPELRSVDPRGIAEYVACGAVLENRTLFSGIEALPQASAWVFRSGILEERKTYFSRTEWESLGQLDSDSFYQSLHSAFERNLPRYFEGKQRIGMSLTGGLDTRMILAARRPAAGSLPCYTFGSMFGEHQDAKIARNVAKHCSQTFGVLVAGGDFLAKFSSLAERAVYLTDGCADVSRAPDLYVNQLARQIAPVRMTGNYGGEVLRAVRVFKANQPPTGLFVGQLDKEFGAAAHRFESIPFSDPVSFAAFQLAPWMLYGTLALEKTQLTLRSPFLDNDVVQAVFRAPASALLSNEVTMRMIADNDRALLEFPTDRGLAGKHGRVNAAISRAYLQFLFKAEYAYDMGMPQWLAKFDHAVAPLHFERLFLGRHKPFHFRVWYRDQLASYLKEMLLDPRSLSRSYIQSGALEKLVLEHTSGRRNHTNEIHKVLTLEIVHRLFVDAEKDTFTPELQHEAVATGS